MSRTSTLSFPFKQTTETVIENIFDAIDEKPQTQRERNQISGDQAHGRPESNVRNQTAAFRYSFRH